ncbi:MAG: hypothetical protein JXP73_20935 [Deltaproteobacteria bacterium]|jgi:3-hydroxymyristoyl/3-hydroxydecanoyl-(acyl carrier protein) dehydratase|nr:hypothetical protein [Deltaproteobacteria bacterium]
MRSSPFIADWRAGPVSADGFRAHLRLDDESLFRGHYPGAPILPGVFLIEALAQAASTFLCGNTQLKEIVSCRFQSPFFPGDVVSARFRIGDAKPGGTLVEVTASGRGPAAELTMLVGAAPNSDLGSGQAAAAWSWDLASARALDAGFVERALPHRPPALLVDSALVLAQPGTRSRLVGYKEITASEPCYDGGEAADGYPASLIVESFCQCCGLLRAATGKAGEARDGAKVPVVAKLASVRWLGEVVPGQRLDHHVELVVRTGEGAVFTGQTLVAGQVVLDVARVVAALASPTRS